MLDKLDTQEERLRDVAHLAMSELITPRLDESVEFFSELLGMYVAHQEGNAVYLRGYEDPYAYSLKLTGDTAARTGATTFRTHSSQALERRAEALKASGLGDGWVDGDFGHGKAYTFHTPDGHPMKLIWDVDYAKVAEADKTTLLNRPSRRPEKGIPVRRLDHVNFLCSNVTKNKNALIENLNFNLTEHVMMDDGGELAAWLRVTALAHDVAFMQDATSAKGRLHHVAFWYGYPQHLMDVAELCIQRGIKVEAGPGKHGISQAQFLYVIEPGGNRVELFGDAGYLVFDPTWKPVTWQQSQLAEGIIWIGSELPQEFFIYGMPHVSEGENAAEQPSHEDELEAVK